MKKTFFVGMLLLLFVGLTSFGAHKFYVSIYQIEYAPEKKMLQVTSRIFIDDLNGALERKFGKKFFIGEKQETAEQLALMEKYFAANVAIKINGKAKPLELRSKEMENNVLICYFRAVDVPKITKFDITNKMLFDYVTEQQNIIQTNVSGKKENLLLTTENPSGTITY